MCPAAATCSNRARLRWLRWRPRLLALLVGVVAAAAIVEGSLRFYGWRLQRELLPALPAVGGDEFLVLCYGESYTAGVGASSRAQAYPAQLARLLQGRSPGRSVRAINRGLPGANSAELADRLERELRELPRRPDLVLLTCCANNIWNLHDCPLLKAGESPPGGQQWLAKVQSLQAGKLASIIGLTGADALARIAAEPTWRPYGFFHTDAPVPALDPSNPAEREFLRRWAREDVRRMAAAVAGAGAKLVLAGYHEGAQLVPVDDAAREAGAVVCDEPWMGRAWGGLGLLSADGWHPNDRGYAAFAAHVAQCLVRHKLWRAEEQAPR